MKELIDDMTWSFSRRDSWDNCKLAWKMSYIDKLPQEGNGFSDAGSLAHDIFEKYGRGELELKDMAHNWLSRYDDEVVNAFPNFAIDLHQHYKHKVFKFFDTFQGFSSETLDVELEFNYELPNGDRLKGFIDRVSEGIIVTDYKISKKFTKKKLEEKKRQILLYAPAIVEKYGELPKSGYFFFFQTGEYLEVNITQKDVDEALKWMTDGIEEIKQSTEFPARIDSMTDKEVAKDMMCSSLCGFRNQCQSKLERIGIT